MHPGGFKTLPDARDFVGRQIVNDDDATLFHLGDEALFEPLLEDHSGHRAGQKLRGQDAIMNKSGDEG